MRKAFTLLELMIVVAIVAVLAVVATTSYKWYLRRAIIAEGTTFLMDIKLKQETYFATYSQYVDTATSEDGFYPTSGPAVTGCYTNFGPGQVPVCWNDIDCSTTTDVAEIGLCALGLVPPANTPTHFQYVTIGWAPGDPDPPAEYIGDPSKRWWFARARTYFGSATSYQTLELRLSSELRDIVELW